MKLSECTMGTLVVAKSTAAFKGEIGHIVGLTHNVQDLPEVIPLVMFAGRTEPKPIHHANLDRYID